MKTMMFFCTILWVSPAFAAEEENGESPATEEQVTAKEGGKLSLLGMECKSEEDSLETTPGSPPLDVDDPDTPGCNGWEINVVTSGEIGKGMALETPLMDINYGIGDNIQLKYEVPYLFNKVDGVSTSGVGRAEFGIKYRFFEDESRDMSMAIYPQLEFAMPGTAAAEGDEGKGTLTKLPVLFSTKVGETSKGDVMLTANLGYNISTEPGAQSYVSAALGIGFPVMSKVAMMLEASTEQAASKDMEGVRAGLIKANIGLIGGITPHLMWFGSVGEDYSSSDADDSTHTCLLLGLRILAGGP